MSKKARDAAFQAYRKSKRFEKKSQEAANKKTKKKKKVAGSNYDSVREKTQNTKKNRDESRAATTSTAKKVGSALKSNTVKKSGATTSVTNTSKQNGRRSGAITSVSSSSSDRRTGASTARTTAKGVGKTIKTNVNVRDVGKGRENKNYVKSQYGTAKGDVARAYNIYKNAQAHSEEDGKKKTLTVSRSQLTSEQKEAQDKAARSTRFYTNTLVASGRMTQEQADKAVENAKKNAKKDVKDSHTLEYTKAPATQNDFWVNANASQYRQKVRDKDAEDAAKREARFYANSQVAAGKMTKAEADKLVKQAGRPQYTTQGNQILENLRGKGAAEKVGTQTAGFINDAKFATGVMQGMAYGDITKNAIGKYNKKAAELVDTATNSGAFNAGYMGGQALQFMLGGTGKMTDALVKGVAKNGAMRSALNIGARKGAADAMFEAPMNALDAYKMSTDANGNFDKNAFVKYMALNSGLSGGMGGIIGGVGSKLAKNDAKTFINLSAKLNSGAGLTEQEVRQFTNLQKKFENIRQGNDVAKTDIINKADYDAEVTKKVFENGGTVDDAIKTVNGGSTHTEKIGYANSIKETATSQFEQLRAAREQMLEQARNTTPEEAKLLRQEASKISGEINRLGEIVNTAEQQLAIELKRNKKAVTELTQNVKAMSEATGINYRVVNDKDMKKLISEAGGDVSDDYFYKGFYYKNKNGETEILINSDSPQAHQTVIGHETGHLIKSANEKEFDDLGNMLEEYARKNDDFDAVYNQLKRSYPEATPEELREEVTCELLGRYVYGADDKFIKQLAGQKPSVVQRIVDYLKKLVNGTSDKEMAKELKAIIDKTEGLVKSVGESNGESAANGRTVVPADENIPAKDLDKSGVTVEKNGEPVAQYDEDGSFKFSVQSYEDSGRTELNKYLDNLVKQKEMSREEADQMRTEMEKIYDVCREYADSGEYAPFSQWSRAEVVIGKDGKPVFSAVKKNAEYEMNIDFSTICKKRRTLDAVFNELVARGIVDQMDMSTLDSAKFVVEMNNIIRQHGFEAACEICFVEARRYRQQATAQAFADLYNGLVESMYKDKSKISRFNYGGDKTISDVADGIHTMDDSRVDLSYLEKVMDDERKKAADKLEMEIPNKKGKALINAKKKLEGLRNGTIDAGSVEAKAARLLHDNPSQRKLLQVGDMIGSKGFENLKIQNPELEKIYNAKKGTGGAKSSFGDVQYLNEIIKSKKFNRDAAYAVGGVRVQSFSDYVPRMVFDYVQMIGDLAAKKLPMHSYTKEPLFAKQFGLSGIKINLSLVPKYVDDGVAAGLDKNGKYIWNENGTFPYDEAVKIQNADGYKDNCGTIAVGVSDEHIEKMLSDPNIQMVIPYHKSSLNPVVADMTNVEKFTNYEKVQTTKDRAGKSISESKDFPFNEELYKLSHGEDGKLLPKEQWGDPRELANRYLKWCDDNGYQPKFPQFRGHENYYKLLEDFGLYDGAGNFKPQHDVQMRFPEDGDAFGSMKDLIKSGLEEDAILEGKRAHDIPAIADEVTDVAKQNGWLSDGKFSKEQKPPQGGSFNAEVEKAFEDAAVEEVDKEIQATKKHQELLNHITDDKGNITREADMEYGDAVKRGDMKTAQEYVDAALESKGYKYDAYHGSDAFGFTEFDLGKMNDKISIFASSERDVAASYTKNANVRAISEAKQPDSKAYDELNDLLESDSDLEYLKEAFDDFERDKANGLEDELLEDYVIESLEDLKTDFGYMSPKGYDIPDETVERVRDLVQRIDAPLKNGGGVYHGKIKMDNPLVVETQGSNWSAIPNDFKKTAGERTGTSTTREVTQYALDNDYDGVIFKELYDSGMYASEHTDRNTWGKSDIYCVFDSEQFKSADPVTRDNNGNIIPLSERGNEKSPDFRFSKEQKSTAKAKEPKKTETQKLSDNKYASDELKSSVKEIEAAGIYKEEVEKAAKRYNDIDKKIAGLQSRLNNAKKKDYPTEAEKTAHIADLEDELRTLRNRQNNVAGEIEQMGKMKAVDDSKTAKEQIRELHGDRSVNKELKNADNLKNEDSWIKDKWNSVRRLWEDSLIDVENVAKKTGGELREQILTSANRVRNSMNVANNWITNSRKSFDNKVGGKALDDIFTKELIQNEAKYNDFQEYLIMKHVPARHAKGTDIYADISPELANKRVKELEKEYGDELKDLAKDVYDYLKDLQQYRVDSGLLSKEAADQFAKDYPFYVPTNRVNDETVDFFTGGTSNGIRTAKGGESEVLDLYSQIYTATNKTIHAAEENQMLNLYFKAKGLTDAQIKDAELSDLEHAVIDAQVNKKTGAATVSFFVDGKPVKLPCSHQLALGLRELDGLEFERLMKAAKVATLYGKPFKALITDWNLVFGVRNGMRDLQQAVVNSKDTKYFGSSMGAAAHAIADNNSPYRKAYASMGGEQAQLVSYDAVAERMGLEKGRVDKIHEKVDEWVDASVNVKGKDVNTNPIHYIEGINGAIEMMPRMCEFIGTLRKNADAILKKQGSSVKKLRKEIVAEVEALEKSGKVGASEVGAEVENRLAERILEIAGKDGLDSAMRNANDITLNFGRSGVLGKALNMGFVPYLNPSIQGLSKLARLFTEAGGEGGWKALASIGMKLGTFTIAPAVWNELALRNNEDFQNINTRDKDNNFFIALGDGTFLKIPKPRENAVLAEPIEYGLRYFIDKTEYDYFDMGKLKSDGNLWDKIPLTDEGKQSFRTALDNIGVINPATSNMFSPLWQTFHNKTWYGGSIETAYEMENKKSQDRYDTGTSGVAIWLGDTAGAKFLNLSPKKIDNIMDSYLGMIYDLGISQTTEEAKTRGNYVVRTMASQFIKDSVFSNKLSTKAWDKVDGMSEEKAQEYKSKYMYDIYKYSDAMDMITADKNMTVQEKMAAKRELQKQKNKLNRAAIDGTDNTSNPLADIAKHLGAHKTLNNFLPKSGDDKYDTWSDYYKNYKKAKGFKGMNSKQKEKEAKKFLDVYTLGVKGQSKVSGDFHDSPSWGMTGVAAAQRYKQGKLSQKDATTIMQSCGVYESQTATYYKYTDHGGNVSRYAVTQKNLNKANDLAEELGVPTSGEGTIWKNKYSKEKGIKGGVYSMSLATGKADFKDRAYYIANSGDKNMLIKMNAARGYSEKYGHTTKQLIKLGKKADKDGNTYLSNDEIESACNTIKKGKATSEEKAMAWVLLGGNPNKNPYGAIGNYSHDGDTGITMDDDGSGGGRGRRGRGRRGRRGGGGGGGKGKKGTMPTTDTGAIKGKVTDPFSTSDGTKPSNLNDTYRKRAKKLQEAMRKRK